MDLCKRYRCILFDMDGTLVDSYEGIFHAYRWTMEQMGRAFEGDPFVRRAIGAPLIWVFENLCGMDFPSAEQAAAQFRAYYAREGKHQVKVYDGMEETLCRLKAPLFPGNSYPEAGALCKGNTKRAGAAGLFRCGVRYGRRGPSYKGRFDPAVHAGQQKLEKRRRFWSVTASLMLPARRKPALLFWRSHMALDFTVRKILGSMVRQ